MFGINNPPPVNRSRTGDVGSSSRDTVGQGSTQSRPQSPPPDERTPLLARASTTSKGLGPRQQAKPENLVRTTQKTGVVKSEDPHTPDHMVFEKRQHFEDGSQFAVDQHRAPRLASGIVRADGSTYVGNHFGLPERFMPNSLIEPHTDAHFHPTNYVQRGLSFVQMLGGMDRVGVRYATAMPIPTNQLDLKVKATLPVDDGKRYALDVRGFAARLAGEPAEHAAHHHCDPIDHYYVPATIVKELEGKNGNKPLETDDWLRFFKEDPTLIDRIVDHSDLYLNMAVNHHLAKSLGRPEDRRKLFGEVEQDIHGAGFDPAQRKSLAQLAEHVRANGLSEETLGRIDQVVGDMKKSRLGDAQLSALTRIADKLESSGLTDAQRSRVDPMITGLHLGDMRASDHLLQTLADDKGIFTGIGEVTVHKELVELMFAGQRGQANMQQRMEPLARLLQTAGVVGMPVTLHCDIDNLKEQVKDRVEGRTGRPPANFEGMKKLLNDPRVKDTTVVLAHAGGLGRFVQEGEGHLDRIQELLDSCPNLKLDISWSEVAKQLTKSPEKMDQWAAFIEKNSDRIMVGSDSLAPTNDGKWAETMTMYKDLFAKLSPDTKEKVLNKNYEDTFVAARAQVREFENKVLTPKFVEKHLTNTLGEDGLPAQPVSVETLKAALGERAPRASGESQASRASTEEATQI